MFSPFTPETVRAAGIGKRCIFKCSHTVLYAFLLMTLTDAPESTKASMGVLLTCGCKHIFDVPFNFGFLAAVPAGEVQAVHGLLRAGQGSQVPVAGDADGITGFAGVVRETDGLCHDGG
jgi:hypothetical protein